MKCTTEQQGLFRGCGSRCLRIFGNLQSCPVIVVLQKAHQLYQAGGLACACWPALLPDTKLPLLQPLGPVTVHSSTGQRAPLTVLVPCKFGISPGPADTHRQATPRHLLGCLAGRMPPHWWRQIFFFLSFDSQTRSSERAQITHAAISLVLSLPQLRASVTKEINDCPLGALRS